MGSKLTSDFWEAFDKATENIKQDLEWQELEFKVSAFLSAAPNSELIQTDLINLIDEQYTMLTHQYLSKNRLSSFFIFAILSCILLQITCYGIAAHTG